ncbi:D-alanyl-D-alanine carboxypeptidase family protein [Cohnella abietis]|uniref:D-alanyl-D-alanine carboxypeptidase n=1 Tax=Cohnella abietis TaxID=2507935 RepID=A0A3T1D4V2_9BACL|nr:D-alanyl-D-alanine carboxypeptidase family protein [Cohnella abietis]BBI33101.1 D-alanyl-D-alanine carboxypeptidase [Cohnella abietis]
MRWKRVVLVIAFIFVMGWVLNIKEKLGFTPKYELHLEAVSAAMMDADTGKWLYLSNAQEPLPPASMSKMMTEILVLDDIRSGKLTWESPVVVSSYAASIGGAGMDLAEGQTITVSELFNGMAIHSANDAAVALAEFSEGSETEFVKKMNLKAAEIGLSEDTFFANSTGLSSRDLEDYATAAANGDTVMTAKDVALLARYLIEIHPEVLKVTKRAKAGDDSSKNLQTTNEMLPGQRFGTKGNDGLKTGYTKQAGYCFTGTTVVDGRRYITVVMGASTPEARFEETKKLLAYGEGAAS